MFGPGIWTLGRFSDPLPEMRRLQRDMNRLFSGLNQPYGKDFPAINIWLEDNDIILNAELPGIEQNNINISVLGDTVTLSGDRGTELLKEGENYHRQERLQGNFSRTVQLPFQVDAAKVNARYDKGVLHITLPRAETDKPKKISIKSA